MQKKINPVAETYRRIPVHFEAGEGSWLTDTKGKRYLDFVTGLAVNSLGHHHPAIVEAIRKQAEKPLHLSNLYGISEQEALADFLCEKTGFEQVFFCNSGTEANEAAIKTVRKYFHDRKENRHEIITLKNSFHGRSTGALAATGQRKYQEDFTPLMPGFHYADINDIRSVRSLITDKTAAIMLEPIQGEGGVNECSRQFLSDIKRICNDRGILLVFDEVQVGMGRTGSFCCFEQYGIQPDLITLAKALGGGLPIGALLGKKEAMSALTPGSHASTFGGNPFVCGVALEVARIIAEPSFLKEVKRKGECIREALEGFREDFPFIKKVKGKGLIIGIEVDDTVADASLFPPLALEEGLLINAIGTGVIRLLPPLNVSDEETETALFILKGIFSHFTG